MGAAAIVNDDECHCYCCLQLLLLLLLWVKLAARKKYEGKKIEKKIKATARFHDVFSRPLYAKSELPLLLRVYLSRCLFVSLSVCLSVSLSVCLFLC